MTDIQYVQLDSSDFLTDIDFQMMDAEQRGVYCSIILYLYCNEGRIELNSSEGITLLVTRTSKLAQMSGCLKTGSAWETLWNKIAHKFQISGDILTHKRVTAELKRVEDYRKAKSDAGKLGMAARWADNTDITKRSKEKVSKEKLKKYIHGDFVKLTAEEHAKLKEKFGEQGTADWIADLDGHLGSKGTKYASHYRTILNWNRKREREATTKSQRQGAPPAGGRQGLAARRDTSESSKIGTSIDA